MGGKTVVRESGERRAIWMLGGLYEILVSGEETGGEATVMEMTIPPGLGAPPHTHPGSEVVHVIEGSIRYHIDDETHDGGPGAVFHIPEGTLEWFEATGDTPVRLVATYLPGGIDQFFIEAGEPAQAREIPPPSDTPPDFERIAEIGQRYGMQIQAPPE